MILDGKLAWSPRAQRLLALALCGFLLALVWVSVVWPAYRFARGPVGEIETQRALLGRFKAEADARAELQLALDDITSSGTAQPLAFFEETQALGLAALERQVREMARGHGATITSLQSSSAAGQEGLERMDVHLTAEVPAGRLGQFFGSLEEAKPFLFVDTLSVRNQDGASSANDRRVPARLRLQVSLHAYRTSVGR